MSMGVFMTEKRSSTQIVLEAIQDLHAQEQIVTRETLRELTGLKLTVIDDRIGALIEDGLVVRVQRGVFVPVASHPPARVISKTVLPDGTVKIDIGDTVLTLTPREDRMLAGLQAGVVMQAAAIELGHHSAMVAGEMQGRLNKVERHLAKMTGDCEDGDDLFVTRDGKRDADVAGVTSRGLIDSGMAAVRELRQRGPMSGAERAKAYRERKKAAKEIAAGAASRATDVT